MTRALRPRVRGILKARADRRGARSETPNAAFAEEEGRTTPNRSTRRDASPPRRAAGCVVIPRR